MVSSIMSTTPHIALVYNLAALSYVVGFLPLLLLRILGNGDQVPDGVVAVAGGGLGGGEGRSETTNE